MKEICQSCRTLSVERSSPPQPHQIWGQCWCQSELIGEESELREIRALAAAAQAPPLDVTRDAELELDVLARLPGGWQSTFAVPLVVERQPARRGLSSRALPSVIVGLLAALALVGSALYFGLAPSSRSASDGASSEVHSASMVALEPALAGPVVGEAASTRNVEPTAVVEVLSDEIEIVPISERAEVSEPSRRSPAVARAAAEVAEEEEEEEEGGAGELPVDTASTVSDHVEDLGRPAQILRSARASTTTATELPGDPRWIDEVLAAPEVVPERESADPRLPRTLSKAQVSAGMRDVASRVRNCVADEADDRIVVNATILGETGRVGRVAVAGPMTGTPPGRCVARAVRQAQFPRFQDEGLNVTGFTFVVR